jgi:hypothetical protein
MKKTVLGIVALGFAAALSTPAAAETAVAECLDMGGMGNYNYYADGLSGVAAMAGAFEGGVHFQQTSEFEQVNDEGRLEANFTHMFVTADGSTIQTEDRSWGYAVGDTGYIVGGGAYTVVNATGRFEGFEGTFNSWGTFAPGKGAAILRYEGQVCRATS